MRILTHLESLARERQPVALAAGFFDGVHRGHRRVLDATIRHARRIQGQAWALTFDPHPMTVIDSGRRPPLLTSTEFRLELLAESGLDGCLLMPFTEALARKTPRQFVEEVLCRDDWHPDTVFAGENWNFGTDGAGSIHSLKTLSHGRIATEVVPPVLDEGEIISSTRIRNAILDGDLQTATRLLGRYYRVRARVLHGRGIGRKLGAATANLSLCAEVLPPHGIYALWAAAGGQIYRAVCDFGLRPTFEEAPGAPPLLEVHLLDFDGNLYDQNLDAAFVAKLRDEKCFGSLHALMEQIQQDIQTARTLLCHPPEDLFTPPHPLPEPEP